MILLPLRHYLPSATACCCTLVVPIFSSSGKWHTHRRLHLLWRQPAATNRGRRGGARKGASRRRHRGRPPDADGRKGGGFRAKARDWGQTEGGSSRRKFCPAKTSRWLMGNWRWGRWDTLFSWPSPKYKAARSQPIMLRAYDCLFLSSARAEARNATDGHGDGRSLAGSLPEYEGLLVHLDSGASIRPPSKKKKTIRKPANKAHKESRTTGPTILNSFVQATLAPPAAGKMMKALVLCYSVIVFTFFLSSITGYWAFGSHVQSNVLKSLMPDSGPALAPTWLLGIAVLFVLLQLLAIGLVYSQVAYEIMEKNSADVQQGRFSRRNLIPRLVFRTLYLAFCAFIAAMLPFFGDIVGVVGAVGFIPLDFVLPVLLYNMALAPPRWSLVFIVNTTVMVLFVGVGGIGAFASIRKLVLDASEFKLFSNNVVD
ncbi:hypothetical protein PR202_ga10465 [Eleusine coracana subsp. coracana]|uniref:Amino acid transporter transmembrane domain-containing protein n=1 Tax=Eleusine coracana subsp. coracana TaxID=191504 RepID=A0AAV5C6W7_ELECO|nr:hypothetical protein PR202_ga10465 [Eleusine coracana subsp. coracana]